MEIADVRKRVLETIAAARRAAAERRAQTDQASADYRRFLEGTAAPLCRQLVNALRAEGYSFTLATPSGAVRLTSDRSADDFVELALDTTGDRPLVLGRRRRRRGGRIIETERPVNERGAINELGESDLLQFLLEELEPFVER